MAALASALAPHALTRHALHQAADGSCVLRVDATEPLASLAPRLRESLVALLGPLVLHIQPLQADDKVKQYTSALNGAHGHA